MIFGFILLGSGLVLGACAIAMYYDLDNEDDGKVFAVASIITITTGAIKASDLKGDASMLAILIVVAVVLIGYAIVTHWNQTDPSKSTAKRVLAAIGIGAAALGAAILQVIQHWTNSGGSTPSP